MYRVEFLWLDIKSAKSSQTLLRNLSRYYTILHDIYTLSINSFKNSSPPPFKTSIINMVKFFLDLLGFAPLLATLAVAGSIQVSYFYDNNCTEFAASPPVVPPNGGEYVWEISGSDSAGINCDGFAHCWCYFYSGTKENTTDTPHQLAEYPSGPFCVEGAFESFECITEVD